MLVIHYGGRFQCRLATDPDPTEELWGISGPTFAGAGEPPLDRLIRLNDPVALRPPFTQAEFGVCVSGVEQITLDALGHETGREWLPDHPLIGARLELLEEARFHQRNYIIVTGLVSPIDPFHLRIRGLGERGGVTITRRDEWDMTRPGLTIDDIYLDPAILGRRKQAMEVWSARLVGQTGVGNYDTYFDDRLAFLKDWLERETDPDARALLMRRIGSIEEFAFDSGTRVGARGFLSMLSTYTMDLNGLASVDDPDDCLGGVVGTQQNWPMEFWLGAYDVDTMTGLMKGTLTLPFFAKG